MSRRDDGKKNLCHSQASKPCSPVRGQSLTDFVIPPKFLALECIQRFSLFSEHLKNCPVSEMCKKEKEKTEEKVEKRK
jgi:hypothetical protein